MELKPLTLIFLFPSLGCLNRTFYGIETTSGSRSRQLVRVLIVPFMELKLALRSIGRAAAAVLIVPFMELKP